MDKKEISISRDALRNAYLNGDSIEKELIKSLVGKEVIETFKQNVMDRVKTFKDACAELGEEHPYVTTYHYFKGLGGGREGEKDIEAYLKLRIITAALNEGWEPQFDKNEYRYYPWYNMYTKEQWNLVDDEDKNKRGVLFGGAAYSGSNAGLVYSYSNYPPSNTHAYVGSRLCYKSSELATYAGKQFYGMYLKFCYKF